MSDPTYSVIRTVDLFSGISGYIGTPYGNPANAILSDGTYCIAAWIEESGNQLIRVFHLSADLTVLGSADIDTGLVYCWPTPYLVALPGNKVFMASRLQLRYGYPTTWASWVMDCSGSVPVPGVTIPMATGYNFSYDSSGIFDVYDQANDRIILTVTTHYPEHVLVQSFRASTGALLAEMDTGEYRSGRRVAGLYIDPNDPTKFKVPFGVPVIYDFTVALDGTSITYDGVSTYSGTTPDWVLAGGSPYIAGGGGFITPDSGRSTVEYWDYSGTVLASAGRAVSDYPNYNGDSACLKDGQYLVNVYEETDGSVGIYRTYKHHGLFVGVDQLAVPPTIELLELSFYGLPSGQYYSTTAFWDQAAMVTADQASGIILVTMTTFTAMPSYDPEYYSLFVWVIQGPSSKPNLSGAALGDRVRFT